MTVAMIESGGWRKRPTPTRPAFRAANTAKTNGATSITVAVPATAVVGDLMLVLLTFGNGRTLTGATGPSLTTLSFTYTSDARPSYILGYRYIQAGDAGTNMSFTLSSSSTIIATAAVYSGVGGVSVKPLVYPCLTTVEAANNRPPRVPTIAANPYDLLVGMGMGHSYTATAVNGSQVATIPSGATLRATDSAPTTGLVLTFGHGLWDASARTALQYEWFAFNQQCNFISLVLALSPTSDGWSAERVPTSLSGKPVHCYANSMGAYVRRQETNWAYNSMQPWPHRIAAALGVTTANNKAMPGSRSQDICTAAYGTYASYNTQCAQSDPLAVVRAITWTPGTDPLDCLVLTDLLGNDAIHGVSNAQDYTSATNAVRALIRLFRASAVKNGTDASCAYTAGWSTVSDTGYQGGTAKQSTTPGDTATITFSGDAIDVVMIGQDDTIVGSPAGATFTIHVDGVLKFTGTTSNQAASTNWGQNYGYVQNVVPLSGLGAGAHTAVITHTGAAASKLRFNCWMTPSSGTVPWIVLNKIEYVPDSTLTTLGVARSQLDNYNALLAPIVADYPDGHVFIYDASASGLWDPGTTAPNDNTVLYPGFISTDGVHMNEIGHAFFAKEILRMLNEKVA